MRLRYDAASPAEALRRVFNIPYVPTTKHAFTLRCWQSTPCQRRLMQTGNHPRWSRPSPTAPSSPRDNNDWRSRLQQVKTQMQTRDPPTSSGGGSSDLRFQPTQGAGTTPRNAPVNFGITRDTYSRERQEQMRGQAQSQSQSRSAPEYPAPYYGNNLSPARRTEDGIRARPASSDPPIGNLIRKVGIGEQRPGQNGPSRDHYPVQRVFRSPEDPVSERRKFSRAIDPFPHLTYDEEIVHDMREEGTTEIVRVLQEEGPPTPPESIHSILRQIRQDNARLDMIDVERLNLDDLKLLNLKNYKLADFKPQAQAGKPPRPASSEPGTVEGSDGSPKELSPLKKAKLAKTEAKKHLVQNSKLVLDQDLICRIMTVGEIRMELRKKSEIQKAQKKSKEVQKQIEINWAVEPNDLKNKLNQMESFLTKGNRVELILAGKRSGKRKSKKATQPEAQALVANIKQKMEEINAVELKPMEGTLLQQVTWTVHRKAK